MSAESIKRVIREELMFANSRRDIKKIFAAAEQDFYDKRIPRELRLEALREVRDNLKSYINHSKDGKSAILIVEAQSVIDELLKT